MVSTFTNTEDRSVAIVTNFSRTQNQQAVSVEEYEELVNMENARISAGIVVEVSGSGLCAEHGKNEFKCSRAPTHYHTRLRSLLVVVTGPPHFTRKYTRRIASRKYTGLIVGSADPP